MKTAISIPDEVFEAADKLAGRLGMSRSELYREAVSDFIRRRQRNNVTEKLNEIYDKEPSDLDSIARAIQYGSLDKGNW